MDAVSSPPVAYRLGHDRRYLSWLTSDFLTGLASSLARFAIPLIALAVTGSPVQAGVIAAIGQVASLLSTMLGGLLADSGNRMRLMIQGCVLGLLIAAAFTALALTDDLGFAALIGINVLLSVRAGIFGIAGETLVKEIVPPAGLGRAQSANQGRDAALSLAGGPLGGVLLAVGAWLVGVAMVACQLFALVAALVLRRSVPRRNEGEAKRIRSSSMWAQAQEGITWLFRRQELRGIAIISTVINLGFNTALTTVIYALRVEGVSPQAIGTLSAAIGAVMLIGALISTFLVTRVSTGVLTSVGLTVSAACMALLPLVTTLPGIIGVLCAGVVTIPALNAGLLGYMMVATPTELLGRVNSAMGVMAMAALPLAPLIAGFGLQWLGRTPTLLLGSAICAVAVVMAWATPSLRRIPQESGWVAHAEEMALN